MQNEGAGRQAFLLQCRSLYQFAGMLSGLFLPHFPANNVATVQVRNQIQVVECSFHRSVKICDVPHPDLVRSRCIMSRNLTFYWSCSTAATACHSFLTKNPVKGGF